MSFFGRPALTAVLSVATAACIFSDPTGISQDYALITPEATTLEAWLSGNVLVVELELSELNVAVPDDVRIPVSVRSASGDVEEVLVGQFVCEDPEWGHVICGRVVIGTDDVEMLPTRLRAFHAFIWASDSTAALAYFPYGTIKEIIATVRTWPEVWAVRPEYLTPAFPDPNPPPIHPRVVGYMAIEDAAVSPGNLFLEAVANDELLVEYAPPSGPALRKEIVFAGS